MVTKLHNIYVYIYTYGGCVIQYLNIILAQPNYQYEDSTKNIRRRYVEITISKEKYILDLRTWNVREGKR